MFYIMLVVEGKRENDIRQTVNDLGIEGRVTGQITRPPLGENWQWVSATKKAEKMPGRIPDRFKIRNAAKVLEEKYTECASQAGRRI